MKLILLLSFILLITGCDDHAYAWGHSKHRFKHYSIKVPKSWNVGNAKPQSWKPIYAED